MADTDNEISDGKKSTSMWVNVSVTIALLAVLGCSACLGYLYGQITMPSSSRTGIVAEARTVKVLNEWVATNSSGMPFETGDYCRLQPGGTVTEHVIVGMTENLYTYEAREHFATERFCPSGTVFMEYKIMNSVDWDE